MIECHDKRCRRDSSRIVRHFESRTSHRAKRRVTLPSISESSSVCRCPRLRHSKRRCSTPAAPAGLRQIPDLDPLGLMYLRGLVAARRAPHHPARVSHVDDQLVELVLHDPHEPLAPEMQPDRHPVGRHGPSPLTDRTGRRSWRQTVTRLMVRDPQLRAPNPNDPRSLRLATMVRQIARARAGGRAGRWRRHEQGSRRRSRCPRARCQHPGRTRRRQAALARRRGRDNRGGDDS
jgi:hypothetical protein